jgi:uncharacterized membrane protein
VEVGAPAEVEREEHEKGSITQTEIKSRSGLSKVKVSRILSRLEQRNVIEKKPHGNTNLIIKKF